MKTFEQFFKEQNADLISRVGEVTFLEQKVFFAEEVIELVKKWQLEQSESNGCNHEYVHAIAEGIAVCPNCKKHMRRK